MKDDTSILYYRGEVRHKTIERYITENIHLRYYAWKTHLCKTIYYLIKKLNIETYKRKTDKNIKSSALIV